MRSLSTVQLGRAETNTWQQRVNAHKAGRQRDKTILTKNGIRPRRRRSSGRWRTDDTKCWRTRKIDFEDRCWNYLQYSLSNKFSGSTETWLEKSEQVLCGTPSTAAAADAGHRERTCVGLLTVRRTPKSEEKNTFFVVAAGQEPELRDARWRDHNTTKRNTKNPSHPFATVAAVTTFHFDAARSASNRVLADDGAHGCYQLPLYTTERCPDKMKIFFGFGTYLPTIYYHLYMFTMFSEK